MIPAIHAAPPATSAWFGPATVDATLPTTGNPFSPTENDVRCVFTKGGQRLERFAYFADGLWHATLAAGVGGTYNARFVANGKPVGPAFKVTLARSNHGEFVRLDGTRFKLASGRPYIPFGHNLGWQNSADKTYPEQFADMHKAGLNWSRVWSDSWDGKNPFVPRESSTKLPLGRFDESALERWDMVVRESDRNAIKLQFVLFHHGLFSSTVNPNWPDHPWNKKNGGFLASPAEFFTDPTAKKLSKAWLRYAVARWGHSPSVMAWELFNEVQWTDATKTPQGLETVAAWHREMAEYLRSIDPYHHLVTSSSGESLDPKVFAAMDYAQPHTYPPSVYGALLGTPAPKDRPLFYGEFGGANGGDAGKSEYLAVRDGVWGGLLAGHAGPGQYWFWDRVYSRDLYPEFARESRIIARSGFAQNADAAPASIQVTGAPAADLAARPGRGWGSTDKFVYNLPEDAATGAFPQLSGYIQGAKGANRSMMKEPIRLRFTAANAGNLTIKLGQASKGGGGLAVSVNGAPAYSKDWPAADRETRVAEPIVVPFPAGQDEIVIDNPGSDWVLLDSIRLDGVGSGVSAACLRSDKYALVRLTWANGFGPGPKTISLPGLPDGTYELRQFDLDKGTERSNPTEVRNGRIANYTPFAPDEALALFRK